METIADRLRRLRVLATGDPDHPMPARALSLLAGLSSSVVSQVEAGNWLPGSTSLVALAETVDCTLDWLVRGGKEPSGMRVRAAIAKAKERQGKGPDPKAA